MSVSKERKKELLLFLKKTGLKFKNLELLNMAFSHASYVYDNCIDKNLNYERLEFLGDAVLKLSVSDFLYSLCPNGNEGELSEKRAFMVADKTLSVLAKKIDMQNYILTGKCEKGKLIEKDSILACVFEAFLGAIYLEYKEKGFIKAKEFLLNNFRDDLLNVDCSNPKANLQEFTQKYNHDLPKYVTLSESGPAHNKTFVAGVYYEGKLIASGKAKSKKAAEFEAAKLALEILINEKEEKNV